MKPILFLFVFIVVEGYTMKKMIAAIVSGMLAVVVAVACIMCLERISVGNVGVVYNAGGVKDTTLTAGWHWMSPFDSVKQFPISQQQIAPILIQQLCSCERLPVCLIMSRVNI